METTKAEIKHRRPPPLESDLRGEFTSLRGEFARIEFNDKQAQTQITSETLEAERAASAFSLWFENACWLLASVACVYFTDIVNVVLYDQTIYRHIMLFAFFLIACNICIAFYLIVYVTCIRKINSNKWNDLYPGLIPIATACFISGSIL